MCTTTAGRFFDALWMLNGNGTRTTSPNSKGIVDVVFGIAPDGRESWHARGSGGAGQRPLLLAQTNEVHKILDLGNALGRQRFDFLDQGLAVGGHVSSLHEAARRILSARIAVTYSAACYITRGQGRRGSSLPRDAR